MTALTRYLQDQQADTMRTALENIVTHSGNFSNCVIALNKCGQIARWGLGDKSALHGSEPQSSPTDKDRLDWMEREGHQLVWDDVYPGVTRGSDGKSYYAPTLREAIDAAIKSENRQITNDELRTDCKTPGCANPTRCTNPYHCENDTVVAPPPQKPDSK